MGPGPYKKYLLLVLTVIVLFNYVDRMALGLALQDIKADLDLSDTQLGFLSGIAFALFYALMGIPIARWADRGNRVTIIALTTALWSIAVALCGAVGNFLQLLLIRVGVAIGEAGCIPPAFSLMADSFSRSERPRAAAIYGMGGALSFVVGFFLAGWLNELYGWRTMFVVLALPGILLAMVAWFTLKDPRDATTTQALRSSASGDTSGAGELQPRLSDVCVTLWRIVSFRHLLLCVSVQYLLGYGILQWQPTFFVRSYGFTTGELGTWLALTYGVGGVVGTYLGGEWATRYAGHNEARQLKAMAIALAAGGVFAAWSYSTRNPYWAFALTTLYVFGVYATNGPLYATIQILLPGRMRAVSISLLYLVANLIGMGLGPLAAGVLSDALRSWLGEESLRYALLALTPGYLWGAWHAWRASMSVARDLANAQLGHQLSELESESIQASPQVIR